MRRWRVMLAVLALAAGACGDDGQGITVPDTAPASTAAPVTTGAPVTTVPDAVPAGAGAASTGSMVLLADDFEDGDAEGWEIDSGWYIVGTGASYGLSASAPAWVWWPEGVEWEASYALRCSFRIDEGGLAVSVAVGPGGRYVVHLHEHGTDLLLDRPWGTFTPVAHGSPVEPGTWHYLAVGVDGGEVQVYVDGEPWLAGRVDDPFASGSVGFGALDGSLVGVDTVYVTLLRGGLPPFPDLERDEPAALVPPPPVVDDPPDEDGADGGEGPSQGPRTNLTIHSMTFLAPYLEGTSIPVEVAVTNTGTEPVGPFGVAWEAFDTACTAEMPGLAPGERGSAVCTARGLSAGLYTWMAFADHDDRIAESDEGDNTMSGVMEIPVGPSAIPDLAITDAWVSSSELSLGQPYSTGIRVVDLENTGLSLLFTVVVTLDGVVACSEDIPAGDPVYCDPDLGPGTHVFEWIVDPEDEVDETREDNNRHMAEVTVVER